MNTLTNYYVPEWISIFFQFAILVPFVLIILFIHKEGIKNQHPNAHKTASIFFVVYLTYITIASISGWFNQVLLPPKVLLLTTFPFAFFLFVFVSRTKFYASVLEKSTLESIVGLHIFRLVGVFFVLLALHNTLPKPFAFIAGIGDMITAISSIFVVNAIRSKKKYAKKLTFYWNIFGTIDILFTAIAANVITKISMDTGTMGVDTLAMFPFCIIPAFAPPMILFLHWTIYKKMKSFK